VANRAETITLTDVPHDDELKQGGRSPPVSNASCPPIPGFGWPGSFPKASEPSCDAHPAEDRAARRL